MAPREAPKPAPTPKTQRGILKVKSTKGKSSPVSSNKKIMADRNNEKTPLKANITAEPRQRTNTVPIASTPKPKENKSVPMPGSVTKSAKKASWKRRPKPAHSGVPVPEKMKRLMEKAFQDSDCSL